MIIQTLWNLIANGLDSVIATVLGFLGAPPSWWPTGGYDAFTGGLSYFLYFFNFPALLVILGFVLSGELLFLAMRFSRRGLSLFTGGGGSI